MASKPSMNDVPKKLKKNAKRQQKANRKVKLNNQVLRKRKQLKTVVRQPILGPKTMQTRTNVRAMQTFGDLITNEDHRVEISATLSLQSYKYAFISFLSYLAQKNVINVSKQNQPVQWDSVYEGTNYLMEQGGVMMSGTTAAINKLPKVFNNFFQAMLPKEVTFDCGKIAYGWKQFDSTTLGFGGSAIPIYGHSWAPTYYSSDNGDYNSLAIIHPGGNDPGHYPTLLAIVNAIDSNGMTKAVAWMDKSPVAQEVSTFARCYSYVGNQSTPQLGGAWVDVENEVEVRAPFLAKFVPYEDTSTATDPRLPTNLKPYSMDSLSVLGWPLHQSFRSYYNKSPPRINHVDCDQIVTVLGLWISKLMTMRFELTGQYAALPFTLQDFYIIVRNALLIVFDNQYFTQFLGNNQWSQNQNAFLGFFVMGGNSGNSIFGNLYVPTILAENLGALKARNISPEGGKNPKTYLPIVGRYYRDTLPQFNVVAPDGSILGPLFDTAVQDPIDFIDTTVGGMFPGFVNTQGTYYQTVLDDWNQSILGLKKFSVDVQPLISDSGPKGLLAALTTRVLDVMPSASEDIGRVPARCAQSLAYVENKPYEVTKVGNKHVVVRKRATSKEKEKKNVQALPDASILNLTTNTILSRFPIGQEAMELFNLIIIPTDRTSGTNDVLLKSMLQVMSREAFSYEQQESAALAFGSTGAGEWARLNSYANEFVTGLARGETTKFQAIFAKLIKDGDAGMLAGLLGGIAKGIFPGMDGLIDTVSSIIPI